MSKKAMDLSWDKLEEHSDSDAAAKVRAEIRRDPLTMIRIATAIGEDRGRRPPAPVTRACREEVGLLVSAPPAALRSALERALLTRDVDAALQWLHSVGAIALVFPELAATVDLAQEAGRRHKDVWEHTKMVVKQAVRRPAVRWAALFHDIGKVPTRTFTPRGVHFHGHAEVGARMFERIARRIPFEPAVEEKVSFLVRHHLRSNQYSAGWSDSAVRRFARDMGPNLPDLLDLSRADITSRRPGRRTALLRQISELAQRVERLRVEDARLPRLPTGLGTAIMERFGLPPSRRIGELKDALEEAIERKELEERRESAYYLEWLATSDLLEESG